MTHTLTLTPDVLGLINLVQEITKAPRPSCEQLVAAARRHPRGWQGVLAARVGLPGIGAGMLMRLQAAMEFGRLVLMSGGAGPDKPLMSSAHDVHARYGPRLAGELREQFWVVLLNAKHYYIGEEQVALGSLMQVEVHPRDVFRPCIEHSAAACIVVHNHPSGDPEPSEQDKLLTQRLRQCADLLGIALLDHVIVAGARHVSLAERGCL